MYSEINTFLLVAGLVGGGALGTVLVAVTWRTTMMLQQITLSFERFLDWQAARERDFPPRRGDEE